MGATVMRRSSMFAPATPLVPDDQDHEREFIPRDLDQERKQRRQPERVNRSVAIRRPPIIKRMAKSLARFCAAVLLGIALTLAWQSHGEQGREIATAWAPSWAPSLIASLDWLLPAANTTKPGEATMSPEILQQMKLLAVDVAVVRRSVGQIAASQEQLSAKQDQLSQNVQTLAQIEQEIKAQSSSPPSPKAIQPRVRGTPRPAPR